MEWVFFVAFVLAATVALYFAFRSCDDEVSTIDDKTLRAVLGSGSDYCENPVAVIAREEKKLLYANKAYRTLFERYRFEERSDKEKFPLLILKEGKVESLVERLLFYKDEIARKRHYAEKLFLHDFENGKHIPFYMMVTPLNIDKKALFAITFKKLQQEKSAESDNKRLYNPLTRLPNELMLESEVTSRTAVATRRNKKVAAILMDLDNFIHIRSILGMQNAKKLIIEIASRLSGIIEKMDDAKLYHLSGDYFLFLMELGGGRDETYRIAKQIQRVLYGFAALKKMDMFLSASIGVAIYPTTSSAEQLVDNAIKALAAAESKGYGRISIFKKDQHLQMLDQYKLLTDIERGLEEKQFQIYFQPIIDAKYGDVFAAEALLRWLHPEHGVLPPSLFIPIMEKTGLIVEAGKFVLEEVLKQIRRWQMYRFHPVQVSVNVTLIELEGDTFIANVNRLLHKYDVSADYLKFEITESEAMQADGIILEKVQELKKMGASIALDDFGTGYTSFSYLKQFPADVLKIDKVFIENVLHDKEQQQIVKSMIDMSHNLGMKSIVEGVEKESEFSLLKELQCDYMQGYYFGKPMQGFEFQQLLREERIRGNASLHIN